MASNDEERRTSPILEECQRLQHLSSQLSTLWQSEVAQYETSTLHFGTGAASQTRNRPNSRGTVEDDSLFPYHTALYPLLDCYDSIRDASSAAAPGGAVVVRPSPAPLPFAFNGHRRSRFAPRLDRHGVAIEELATLVGHLPNSAWAVRRLMPLERRVQLDLARLAGGNGGGDGPSNNVQVEGEPNDVDDQPNEAPRHQDNTRFWNILMDPVSGRDPVPSSDVSVPPLEEAEDVDADADDDNDEWEDTDEEVDDNDGEWEDVDDEEDEHSAGLGSNGGGSNAKDARDWAFLKWWQRDIVEERRGAIGDEAAKSASAAASIEATSMHEYSPESLFTTNPSATFTLLRVLKHSLSDLQREFRLARAVVLLMADWRLCDGGKEGIECLRRLLTIVSSEYVESCSGYCHEWYVAQGGISDNDDEFEDVENDNRLDAPNHYCSDWWEFLGALSTMLSRGITYMTREHANVICAFVVHEINSASGAAEGLLDTKEVSSGKAYLKQNLYFMNNAEYDSFGRHTADGGPPQEMSQLRVNLLLMVLSALRQKALSDKMCLAKLLGESSEQLSKSLKSFEACIEIMVDIGERCLLRLPVNNHGRQLGGMIVRGLVEAYSDRDGSNLLAKRPLTYLAEKMDTSVRSVIDPLRYADAVTGASANPLLDQSKNRRSGRQTMEQLIGFQPPQDVQDVVRALFMRDLVDLRISGCGYGDFLSWCHLPISPEPLIFDYISNFPNLSDTDVNGEPRDEHWAIDEDDIALDQGRLSARYDFSLLVFLRQWDSPWTPESHLSYSIPYRRAVSTLALCAHRVGVPAGITNLVISYLPRTWWPDDRRCCWCRDCQLKELKERYQDKIKARQSNWGTGREDSRDKNMRKTPTLMTCPHCQIAMACSKEHLKYLHQDGHKRYCGLPPFRPPFSDEDNALCREVFGDNEEANATQYDNDGGSEECTIDDDGSWESVDSAGEDVAVERQRSDIVYNFMNLKSYKLQRREAAPFADFF